MGIIKSKPVKVEPVVAPVPAAAPVVDDIATLKARLEQVERERDLLKASKGKSKPVTSGKVNSAMEIACHALEAKLRSTTMAGSDLEITRRLVAIYLVVTDGTTSRPTVSSDPVSGGTDCDHTRPATAHYRHTDAYGISYGSWTRYKDSLTTQGLITSSAGSGDMPLTALGLSVVKGEQSFKLVDPEKASSAAQKALAEKNAEIEKLRAELASKVAPVIEEPAKSARKSK